MCPLDIVAEHAQQDVSAHALFEAMVDGADLEVNRLETAEGLFDLGQELVSAHRLVGRECRGRDTGADHVDAVERRFARDALFIAGKAEAGSPMSRWKCLRIW